MKKHSYHSEKMRQIVRGLANEKVQPLIADADREALCPGEIPEHYRSLDLYRMMAAEDHGGFGASIAEFLTVVQEISAVCAGMAAILTIPAAGLIPVSRFADGSKLMGRYAAYLTGERFFGYALSAADGVFGDVNDRVFFIKENGAYVLSGTVPRVLLGGLSSSVVLIAYEDPDDPDAAGTAFIVEKDMDGVTFGDSLDTLGLRALPVCSLALENCSVPAGNVVGDAGQAHEITAVSESAVRLMAAAQALGIIRCAYENARSYSMQRVQFGKPVGTFQSIEHMLVDMTISLRAGQGIVNLGAAAYDAGDDDATVLSAQAKLYCTEAAMTAATDSVQIHGGYGYMRDFPVEKLMRDAKMLQVLFGTPHHLKTLIASKM